MSTSWCPCRFCTNELTEYIPPAPKRVRELDPTWTYPYATRHTIQAAERISSAQQAGTLKWKWRAKKLMWRGVYERYLSWCAEQDRLRLGLDRDESPRPHSKVLEIA